MTPSTRVSSHNNRCAIRHPRRGLLPREYTSSGEVESPVLAGIAAFPSLGCRTRCRSRGNPTTAPGTLKLSRARVELALNLAQLKSELPTSHRRFSRPGSFRDTSAVISHDFLTSTSLSLSFPPLSFSVPHSPFPVRHGKPPTARCFTYAWRVSEHVAAKWPHPLT